MTQFSCKSRQMYLLFTVVAFILVFSCSPVVAGEEEKGEQKKDDCPTASVYVDFLSQYVFRGVAFSADSAVIQPSATLAYKGLSLSVWGNLDTSEKIFGRDARWNETDITLAYAREIFTGLTATVGTIYYVLANSPKDSVEAYAGLSYAFPWFTVGVTGYREFKYFPGWWMQIDLSRNFKLPYRDMSIDLGVSIGYLDSNPQGFADWHSGQISAALNVPVTKCITISPKVGFAFPITGDGRDNIKANSWDGNAEHVFGGIRIAASF